MTTCSIISTRSPEWRVRSRGGAERRLNQQRRRGAPQPAEEAPKAAEQPAAKEPDEAEPAAPAAPSSRCERRARRAGRQAGRSRTCGRRSANGDSRRP
ncbi:MAG: hypothetical protein WKF58_10795 [Ilumatobacteraceae bacterium]